MTKHIPTTVGVVTGLVVWVIPLVLWAGNAMVHRAGFLLLLRARAA